MLWMWLLFGLAYVVAPFSLVTAWLKLVRAKTEWSLCFVLSAIGFGLANSSALLAFGTISYAQNHRFPYYDPLLLTIFGLGMRISLLGTVFAIGGIWRKHIIGWHSFLASFGTLAFWVMSAAME